MAACLQLPTQLSFLILSLVVHQVVSWDNDDLELFDLVEEVNQNFYDFMGVDSTASGSELRKAYRKLSLEYHPDKNKEEGAELKFRQLVAVYDVLKDENKKEKYKSILENGLPDWRQPVFYYRRVRKMGMTEFAILMCIILTIGQYLVMWSVYAEKKFTLQENVDEVRKKKEKKVKKNQQQAFDEQMDQLLQSELVLIPRPKLTDLWLYRFSVWSIHSVVYLPQNIAAARKRRQEEREQKLQLEKEAAEEEIRREQEIAELKAQAQNRPKKKTRLEILESIPLVQSEGGPVLYTDLSAVNNDDGSENKSQIKTGKWTDDDYVLLAKAVHKFPGGTTGRWEKIAEMVGRPLSEVTAKSKNIKSNYTVTVDSSIQSGIGKGGKKAQHLPDNIISTKEDEENGRSDTQSFNPDHKETTVRKRVAMAKTQSVDQAKQTKESHLNGDQSSGKLVIKNSSEDVADNWNKNLQTIFEWALRQYPKGTDQRWEKIAHHIPGKSKEDCISRFKYLAEIVKKKKEVAS